MNLMSIFASSEICDQCLVDTSEDLEIGSWCQLGGKPVRRNWCAKYFISPERIRSASSIADCLFHGVFSGYVALSKKNLRKLFFRHWVYSCGVDGISFFSHVSRG